MAKDPAFLFYTNDFSSGTQFFSDEQVGKYLRLLMAQHQHGHLTQDQMIFICKSYDLQVFSKFAKDEKGLWFNERLEIEIIKRKKFTDSRSKNKSGKTKKKNISKSYDSHMENENENENIIELKGVQGENKTDQFTDEWFAEIFNELELENIRSAFREHDLTNELMIFKIKVRGSPDDYRHRDSGGIRKAFIYQLKNSKGKKHDRGYSEKSIRRADAIIEAPTGFGKF